MINPFNLMQMYYQLKQNPAQMLASKFNIPSDMNNP